MLAAAAPLAPRDPEIEHNRGTMLMRLGRLDEARGHFVRAIELNPESADNLYILVVVPEGLGRTNQAIRRCTAAAAFDPTHVAARCLAALGLE